MAKGPPRIPESERLAVAIERKLLQFVENEKGRFMKDDAGALHLVIGDRKIPIKFERENLELAQLMLEACNMTTLSTAAQAAIQRFQVSGRQKAEKIHIQLFAALSPSGHIYVPLASGQLLQIGAEAIVPVSNGENADSLWVEHPNGDGLDYKQVDVRAGLALFERLVVDTQACHTAAMRWFVAMHEGLFPFVRQGYRARLLVAHAGGTQQGKTTGAQRFTLLHGLGEVKGDYTPAALANVGDIGLLVMDNKEQANFGQKLIDFCLFLATGAERARSSVDGRVTTSNKSRPVAVITTIEGAFKEELQARFVEVQYEVAGNKTDRETVENSILENRHEILSSLMHVLQRWLSFRSEKREWPTPVPGFAGHVSALCDLLCAYGEVAGKPHGWAESITETWNYTLSQREADENELELPLRRVFDEMLAGSSIQWRDTTYQGRAGRLYLTECGQLLACLQRLRLSDRTLPRNEAGLGRRLRSAKKFNAFTFLDTDTPEVPELRRTATKRPIGFFFEHDTVTVNDKAGPPVSLPQAAELQPVTLDDDSMTVEVEGKGSQ